MSKNKEEAALLAEISNSARCWDGWWYMLFLEGGGAVRVADHDAKSAVVARIASAAKTGEIVEFSGAVQRVCSNPKEPISDENPWQPAPAAALEGGGGFFASKIHGIRYMVFQDDHPPSPMLYLGDDEDDAGDPEAELLEEQEGDDDAEEAAPEAPEAAPAAPSSSSPIITPPPPPAPAPAAPAATPEPVAAPGDFFKFS